VIYGLAVRANGDVYAAMATGPDQGVYRWTVMATSSSCRDRGYRLPERLAFDDRGNLYVRVPFRFGPCVRPGGVWRIPPGAAEVWMQDDLLTGFGAMLGFRWAPTGSPTTTVICS